MVEVTFDDNSGLCKDATRVVKFITPVPVMTDAVDYCSQEEENVFKECTPELGEVDSTFLVNPFNDFQKRIIQDGREIRMVTRTFQVYKGTSIVFEQSENRMEDVFKVYFENHDCISAMTWCDGEFKQITIKNGSRL